MDIKELINAHIVDVPDFPKEGIIFKDITPVLGDPETLKAIIDHLAERFADMNISRVVGVESRGFIFGTALAYAMGKGFVLIRKPGKLPRKTHRVTYDLEYGTDTLEIHDDALEPGERVLVIDDLLATGGTAEAACKLVEAIGAEVACCAFVIELAFLNGRARIGDRPVESILTF